MEKPIEIGSLAFHPLTAERWDDFVELLGPHGAYGCWCMYWRITRAEFSRDCGEPNKLAMRELVFSGVIPGIIGYLDGQPCTWCSIAPREDFSSLERSRTLKRPDDQPVWSIVCFYIAPQARRSGLLLDTIRGALEYARRSGAALVEAYPVDVEGRRPSGDLYMGIWSVFKKAGFKLVDPRGRHNLVRCEI